MSEESPQLDPAEEFARIVNDQLAAPSSASIAMAAIFEEAQGQQ